MESEIRELLIPDDYAGQRLDRVVAELWPEYSRSRLQSWLKDGHLLVDGQSRRPRDVVTGGEQLSLQVPATPVLDVQPEALPLDIVHEDADLLVINKPAGLVVHPGAGNAGGTLQNALLHHAPTLAQVPRAGLVHRLDKDTTGLLVVAKTLVAHTALVEAMQSRQIHREYESIVCGVLTAGGHVQAALGRHPRDRKRMAVLQNGGRAALTHYRVLARFRAHSHLRLKLETGRTHQIRVHMQHIRHPIVGDPVYGRRLLLPPDPLPALKTALSDFQRQALHAAQLGLKHPTTGEELSWQVPVPADMQTVLEALRADAQSRQHDA